MKSQTYCPTCGSKVKIGLRDASNHYYIPVEKENSQDEIWAAILCSLDIWARSCKGSNDTDLKIQELKSKFTITKR